MKILNENKATNLKTALFNRGGKIKTFAILTAENPNGTEYTGDPDDVEAKKAYAHENNKRTERLYRYLSDGRYYYIKIKGKYGADEHSVMIVNIPYRDALWIAKEYDQESFFWADESGISYYQKNSSTGEYEFIEKSNRIDDMDEAENFFSKYHDFQFKIYMQYFEEGLGDSINEENLERSLDGKRSVKSRYFDRCFIYKNVNEELFKELNSDD